MAKIVPVTCQRGKILEKNSWWDPQNSFAASLKTKIKSLSGWKRDFSPDDKYKQAFSSANCRSD